MRSSKGSSTDSRRRFSRLRTSTSSPTWFTTASRRSVSMRIEVSTLALGATAGGTGGGSGWSSARLSLGVAVPWKASSNASKSSSLIGSPQSSPRIASTLKSASSAAGPPHTARNDSISAGSAGVMTSPLDSSARAASSQLTAWEMPSTSSALCPSCPVRTAPMTSSAAWHNSTMGWISRNPALPLSVWNTRNSALSCSGSAFDCSKATICSPSESIISPASVRKSASSSWSMSNTGGVATERLKT